MARFSVTLTIALLAVKVFTAPTINQEVGERKAKNKEAANLVEELHKEAGEGKKDTPETNEPSPGHRPRGALGEIMAEAEAEEEAAEEEAAEEEAAEEKAAEEKNENETENDDKRNMEKDAGEEEEDDTSDGDKEQVEDDAKMQSVIYSIKNKPEVIKALLRAGETNSDKGSTSREENDIKRGNHVGSNHVGEEEEPSFENEEEEGNDVISPRVLSNIIKKDGDDLYLPMIGSKKVDEQFDGLTLPPEENAIQHHKYKGNGDKISSGHFKEPPGLLPASYAFADYPTSSDEVERKAFERPMETDMRANSGPHEMVDRRQLWPPRSDEEEQNEN